MKQKILTIFISVVLIVSFLQMDVLATEPSFDNPETIETTGATEAVGMDAVTSEELDIQSMIKTLLIGFAIIWTYRLASNISNFLRVHHYQTEYTEFLEKQNFNFAQYTEPVVQLFKAAGVQDRAIAYTQPSGYGYLSQGNASLFLNINNVREDTVHLMLQCFAEAKGAFRHRIFENFSPIFWINSILFLPKTVLKYLGVNGDSFIIKLIQLIYWVLTPVCIILRDYISQYIISLIG